MGFALSLVLCAQFSPSAESKEGETAWAAPGRKGVAAELGTSGLHPYTPSPGLREGPTVYRVDSAETSTFWKY